MLPAAWKTGLHRKLVTDTIIALAVFGVVLCVVIAFREGFKGLVHLLLAVLVWIAYKNSRTQNFLSVFPYAALFYLGTDLPYLLSSGYPRADSWSYHVVNFEYFAEAFRQGAGFPEWYASAGGIRIGFSHINTGFALPHRLFGYALYALTPLSVLTTYKLSVAFGVLLLGLGVGLFLERLTASVSGALVGSLAIMLGGVGATTVHQEQVVFTATWIPWILLALYEIKNDRRWLLVIGGLLGLSAVAHYPQIQMVSIGLYGLVAILVNRRAVAERLFIPGRGLAFLAIALFILAILPLPYIATHLNDLLSNERGTLIPKTWEEYTANRFNLGVTDLIFIKQYLFPVIHWDVLDPAGLFIGRITVLLAIVGLIFNFSKSLPAALLAGIFAFLVMGSYAPINLVSVLYHTMPLLIRPFRQWYHFFPLLNLCLAAIAAFGTAWLIRRISAAGYWRHWLMLVFYGIAVAQATELADYSWRYAMTQGLLKPLPSPFDRLTGSVHSPSIVQYKNRLLAEKCFPRYVLGTAYLTTNMLGTTYLTTNIKSVLSVGEQLTAVCSNNPSEVEPITVANIPTALLPKLANLVPAVEPPKPIRMKLQFDGINIDVETNHNSLLVAPINYDLGVTATINGDDVNIWRTNAALVGVLVTPGKHAIKISVVNDAYLYILWIHIAVTLITVMLITVLLSRRSANSFS